MTLSELCQSVKEKALYPFDMCGYQPKVSVSSQRTKGGSNILLVVQASDALAPFSVKSVNKFVSSVNPNMYFVKSDELPDTYVCFVPKQ